MNSKLLSISLAAVVVAALASTARADNFQYTGMNLGNAETATLYMNGNKIVTAYTGKIDFVNVNTSTAFSTVCADINSDLNSGSHSYNLSSTDPLGSTGVDKAGRIVGQYFALATTADQQAGLQLAVWDALYNGSSSFDLTGSKTNTGFSVTGASSGALTWGASYYAAVNTNFGSATYLQTSASGGQSQLTAQAVPEPASIAALGVGLVGLFVRRRRA